MAWDRELQVLEEAIRKLNAEYDAFLYGAAAKPPLENRKRLEQMIRQLTASESDSAADRYRFTTLQGRYNALCERWDRLQSEKEAGRRPGLYGRFRPTGESSTEKPSSPPNTRAAASVEQEDPAARDRDRELYERYISAKKTHGENVKGYDFGSFVESLKREREKLQQHLGSVEIEFDVTQRDGRVKLVARRRV